MLDGVLVWENTIIDGNDVHVVGPLGGDSGDGGTVRREKNFVSSGRNPKKIRGKKMNGSTHKIERTRFPTADTPRFNGAGVRSDFNTNLTENPGTIKIDE